jgi:hypothetical protein
VKASLATPLREMRNREDHHRLYATDDHTQRDAQASDGLADGIASASFTVKTVDPHGRSTHVHVSHTLAPG